jgi:hypothetical protein
MGRRKVRPKLKTVHATFRITFRHFLMNYTAARRHPLHIAGTNHALIAHAIAVFNVSGKHIRDSLHAAMGMPRKAFEKISRLVGTEIIEQEEWIKQRNFTIAEGSMQMYSSAFDCRFTPDNFPDFSIFRH